MRRELLRLLAGRGGLVGGLLDGRDLLAHRLADAVEQRRELSELVGALAVDLDVELARLDRLGVPAQIVDGAVHVADDERAHGEETDDRDADQDQHAPRHVADGPVHRALRGRDDDRPRLPLDGRDRRGELRAVHDRLLGVRDIGRRRLRHVAPEVRQLLDQEVVAQDRVAVRRQRDLPGGGGDDLHVAAVDRGGQERAALRQVDRDHDRLAGHVVDRADEPYVVLAVGLVRLEGAYLVGVGERRRPDRPRPLVLGERRLLRRRRGAHGDLVRHHVVVVDVDHVLGEHVGVLPEFVAYPSLAGRLDAGGRRDPVRVPVHVVEEAVDPLGLPFGGARQRLPRVGLDARLDLIDGERARPEQHRRHDDDRRCDFEEIPAAKSMRETLEDAVSVVSGHDSLFSQPLINVGGEVSALIFRLARSDRASRPAEDSGIELDVRKECRGAGGGASRCRQERERPPHSKPLCPIRRIVRYGLATRPRRRAGERGQAAVRPRRAREEDRRGGGLPAHGGGVRRAVRRPPDPDRLRDGRLGRGDLRERRAGGVRGLRRVPPGTRPRDARERLLVLRGRGAVRRRQRLDVRVVGSRSATTL
ncbi:hypothetical protein BN903_365 [Halorubrum sp. AJ67]|nr:hypothetical protein BN903_365 [Halorubrum sp. AJ67]